MNFFNTITSRLVGGLDVNSLTYINQSNVPVTYDPSGGTDFVDYNDVSYGSTAIGLNVNDTNTTFVSLEKATGTLIQTSDLLQDPFKGFSVYMKYKLRDNSSNQVFSQYGASNPVVQLYSSHTEINRGDQLQITVFQNGYADLSYVITGVTSANLNGADLSGTISDLYTVLSYDIQPGVEGGTLVFVAGDASLNISTFPTYFVKTVQNVLEQTVFALKGPGETDFVTQPDLSFNAGDMFMFDVSDPTMNGFSLVFGTTVDSAGSIVTEYVSGSGTELILDIPGDYSGNALKYFEDTSAGMGYNLLNVTTQIGGDQWSQMGSAIDKTTPLRVSVSNTKLITVDEYVYEYNGTSWNQKGSLPLTLPNGPSTRTMCSISDDGSIILCAYDSNANGSYQEEIETFMWNGSNWLLHGVVPISNLGTTTVRRVVKISGNGHVAVIGFWKSNLIEIYSWNGSTWVLDFSYTNTTTDSVEGGRLGWNVDCSEDGSVVLASGVGGPVLFVKNNGTYSLQQQTGFPTSASYGVGSISADSTHVILLYVTAWNAAYHYEVFAYDGSTWSQKGSNISSNYNVDRSGFEDHNATAFINKDGSQVTTSNVNYSPSGMCYNTTYTFDGTSWVETTSVTIQSVWGDGRSSQHVSSDGRLLVIGDRGYADKVYVYDVPAPKTNYTVTVSGDPSVFYLDDGINGVIAQPDLQFESGTLYKFDQSHTSNSGNQLVLGTTSDISSSMISYQTVVGTPGQPGAYTSFTATEETVYYFSYETPYMGFAPPTYTVKTVQNVLEQTVFALKGPGETDFVTQPDLSFNAGDMFMFDVSDPTMNGFSLVFGTTVDVSNSIVPEVVQVEGTTILLEISAGYTGGALYYFEDTSAGMGYAEIESDPYIDPPNSQRSYSGYYTDTNLDLNNSELGVNNGVDICWAVSDLDSTHWMNIDIGSTVKVVGTQTKGRYNNGQRVTKYIVEYSLDDVNYLQVDGGAEMIGNVDNNNDIVKADFSTPVIARYIKITPTEWVGWISMSAGLIIEPPSTYTVTVSGDPLVFYIDETPQPNLTFTAGETYVFDQSDSTNNNQLVLGTVPDLSSSMISYQTVVGTPGQAGAYTSFTATEETVYYFSYETPDMGFAPPTYEVKTVQNVLEQTVFALKGPGETDFVTQPDLSFNAGDMFMFDVSDPTMNGFSLVFGTTVDVSSTIQSQYYSQYSDFIVLSIPADYSGNVLKYFEDTSAGMGYVEASLTSNTMSSIFNGVTEPKFYWDYRTNTPESDATSDYVLDVMNVDGTNLKARSVNNLVFSDISGPRFNTSPNYHIKIDPFTFGGKCSIETYYYLESFVSHGRAFDFAQSNTDDSFYLSTVLGGNNQPYFAIRNGSSAYSSYGSDSMSLHTWYQTVITVDENGSVEAYINKNDQGLNFTASNPNIERASNLVGSTNFTSNGSQNLDGHIAYTRIWQDHVLTTNEISKLYDSRNKPYGFITNEVYTVTVSGDPAVFYIDDVSKPQLTFTAGDTYIFDQSHSSNTGHPLVIGTTADNLGSLVSYQTVVGTPGQPGAYTTFTATEETVYYFSYETPDMGYVHIPPEWTQLGSDIDGEAAGDEAHRVSISADGTTIALGATKNAGGGTLRGHVRVFTYTNSTWTQKGSDLDGSSDNEEFGRWTSLSSDGDTLVVGAPQYNSAQGYIKVYTYSNSAWSQKGSTILGETTGDGLGSTVAISSDGNTVMGGATLGGIGSGASGTGYGKVYTYSNSTWTQKGQDLDGEAGGDRAGSVSMTPDGNTVAIGAYKNSENGTNSGHVRVFYWNVNTWTQKGSDIDGEAAGDFYGFFSVSLSSDGNTVASGARYNDGNGSNSGHARVFTYTNNAWTQKGSDIDGEAAGDGFGASLQLSSDGNTVVIGAPINDGNGTDAGHTRVFAYTNNAWVQKGSDIDGEAAGDRAGELVALSSDGSRVAIGARANDGTGTDAGHVRVFEYS